jgi:hypothetical protein
MRKYLLLDAVPHRRHRHGRCGHIDNQSGHGRLDELTSVHEGGLRTQSPATTMRSRRTAGFVIVVAVGLLLGTAGTAWATNWVLALHTGSSGEPKAQGAPATPAGATAVCTSSSGKTIKVSWSTVTKATSYSVYEATTSASGTYSLVASGVSATSWTSGTLSAANYWFEVAAYVGTNWLGTKSSATAESTISSSGCVQP